MSALKPCPFCGGTEGRFATDAQSTAYTGKWGWWECSCGARADDVRTGYDANGWQDDAIAAWNRRAGDGEVDALKRERDAVVERERQAMAASAKAKTDLWVMTEERDGLRAGTERLRAEVERLREALRKIADIGPYLGAHATIARAALGDTA